MNRHNRVTQTFKQILVRVAAPNAERLMTRAVAANRLAKAATTGEMRRGAYRVKTAALLDLHRRFPAQVRVRTDAELPAFVLIEYTAQSSDDERPGRRSALHVPAAMFNL